VTGASYSAGTLEVDSAVSRRCVYGAQTPHVFEVIFVQGSSVAEATAYANTLRAEAEAKIGGSVAMSKLSGIGDDAEYLHSSGAGIEVSGLYVRVGAAGFALVDVALGQTASLDALKAEAQTVIGRLP
jgi:hypothetical protein